MSDPTAKSPADQNHLASLDLVRAVASLAVCWNHFAGAEGFLPDGLLQTSGRYAWLGVEMFYVVSGFVIPWSLQRGGYSLASYGRFVLKRVVRLDPPYLLSILLVLSLGYLSMLSPLYHGKPFAIDWGQVALHLGYLNVFFQNKPWLNTVYWTLAIEFEYYLLIGLVYPLLVSASPGLRRGALALFVLSCVVLPDKNHLFHYAPIFALGITAFQLKTGVIGQREGTLATVLISLTALTLGGPQYQLFLPVALLALAAILFVTNPPTGSGFFGRISYSIYLLHVPLGMRVINLSLNWSRPLWMNVAVIGVAFAVTIIAAYLFYRFIEKPSQQLSWRIKYRRAAAATRAAA